MKKLILLFLLVFATMFAGAQSLLDTFNAKCDSVSNVYGLTHGTEAQNIAISIAMTGEHHTLWSLLMTSVATTTKVTVVKPCPEYAIIYTGGIKLMVDSSDVWIAELAIRELEATSEAYYQLKVRTSEEIKEVITELTNDTTATLNVQPNDVFIGGNMKRNQLWRDSLWNHTQKVWVELSSLADTVRDGLYRIKKVRANHRIGNGKERVVISVFSPTVTKGDAEWKDVVADAVESAEKSKYIYQLDTKAVKKNDLSTKTAHFKGRYTTLQINTCTGKLKGISKLLSFVGLVKNPNK